MLVEHLLCDSAVQSPLWGSPAREMRPHQLPGRCSLRLALGLRPAARVDVVLWFHPETPS